MSFLGSAAGAVADGIFSIYSANKAYTRQKEMMKNAHQWEVEDLRKAGLNPILSGTGGSGAGSFNAPQAEGVDTASAIAADKMQRLQNKLGDSTIDLNQAAKGKNEAEALLSAVKTIGERAAAASQIYVNENILPIQKEEAIARVADWKASAASKILNANSTAKMADAALGQVNVGRRRNEIDVGRFSTPIFSGNVEQLKEVLDALGLTPKKSGGSSASWFDGSSFYGKGGD